ncbi:MAG: alpha/beta fold hydrolase [Acidobacteriota bacterium]
MKSMARALGLLVGLWTLTAEALPGLSLEPFPWMSGAEKSVAAELGRLRVPIDHRRPASGEWTLAFVRLPAIHPGSGPPIVYLAGGPGGSGIDALDGPLIPFFQRLREFGDVIALDPRGVGRSQPRLHCRASWRLPVEQPLSPLAMLTHARQGVSECAQRLAGEGVRLEALTTAANVEDLEVLRRGLGAEALRLVGFSYGSQWALEAIRRDPERVTSAVLLGVDEPSGTFSLPHSVDARFDELVSNHGEDLPAVARRVKARLELQPATVELPGPDGGTPRRIVVGPFDFQLWIIAALSRQEGVQALPAVLRAMDKGEFNRLAEDAWRRRKGWLGSLVPYLVRCATPLSKDRRRMIDRQRRHSLLGRAVDFPFPDLCDAVPTEVSESEFGQADAEIGVPVLLISGSLDGRTPPARAVAASRRLSRASLETVVAGHGAELALESVDLVVDFLRRTARKSSGESPTCANR